MKLLSFAFLGVLLLQTPSRPQGSIEGTVTRLGTGQPLPSARVIVTRRLARQPGGPASAAPSPITPAMTDEKGKFTFQSLEEGNYDLRVEANGYVPRIYGQRSPDGAGTPIPVGGGQAMRDVNVALTPAATVSGRIRDTGEKPLINVPVQLLRYSYTFDGQRIYQSVGTTSTNDRGEYRLYWVVPGRYYLLAGRPSNGDNLLAQMAGRGRGATVNGNQVVAAISGYAFYPGVTEVGKALSLDLQPGADLQAIDLALTPNPRTYTLRGKVIDSRTGQPPPRANVVVATQTPGLSDNGTDGIRVAGGSTPNYNPATGAIEIRGLLPGTYTVTATVQVQDQAAVGRGGPAARSSGSTSVSISSADVDDILLSVAPAGSIPGRLRLEGNLDPGNTIDRLRVLVQSIVSQDTLRRSDVQAMSPVSADGGFLLNNVPPGDYRLEVSSTPARIAYAGGFTKEARFEALDALNNPLHFSGGTSNSLDIVVAGGGGKLNGMLTDARSQPVPNSQVVLVPDRSRFRWDVFRTSETDQNGRFTFSAIPPGDYKLYAWESMEQYAWFDPQILGQYETRGRPVHVKETSNETIDVRIIAAEGRR